MMRRLGIVLTLTLLVFVASSSMAGNGRVEIIRFIDPGVVEVVADCGDYFVETIFDGVMTVKLHFDKDGNLIKDMVHFKTDGQSTYYNSVDPSIAIKGGPEGIVMKTDYVDGKLTISGVNFKVTLPGVGMIFHQGGHYVCDLAFNCTHVGGPDDYFSGNTDALCEALAP